MLIKQKRKKMKKTKNWNEGRDITTNHRNEKDYMGLL